MNRHEIGRENRRRLAAIAADQQGFFSAPQAVAAGYPKQAHSRYVSIGEWERVAGARGIFRLAILPEADRPDLVVNTLWTRGTDGVLQGVVSHVSALALWDLGDFTPDMVDMTVPPGFRRTTSPPYQCRLHAMELRERDVEHRPGYRLTRPLETLVAVAMAGDVQDHQVREALREAVDRGLIVDGEIDSHPMPPGMRETFRRWLR